MNKTKTTRWEFNLMDQVTDVTNGFKGLITGRLEYLNGCTQYKVEPKVDKDGKQQEAWWVDGAQLKLKGQRAGVEVGAVTTSGGASTRTP